MLYLVQECIEVVCAECRKKGVDLTRVKGQHVQFVACGGCGDGRGGQVWRAWWASVEGTTIDGVSMP